MRKIQKIKLAVIFFLIVVLFLRFLHNRNSLNLLNRITINPVLAVTGVLKIGTGAGGTSCLPNQILRYDASGNATCADVATSLNASIPTFAGVSISSVTTAPPLNGLFVQGAVGIGIATPSSILHVAAAGTSGGAWPDEGNAQLIARISDEIVSKGLDLGYLTSNGHAYIAPSAVNKNIIFGYWNGTANVETMRITQGKIGIGTNNPLSALQVDAPSGSSALNLNGAANNFTQKIVADATNNQSLGLLIQAGTNTNDSALKITNTAGTTNILYVRGDGRIGIGTLTPNALLQVKGTFSANSKNFDIPHPLDPENKRLIHSTLEGPEIAVFYRGESALTEGKKVITLPPYFEALTRKERRTIILTNIDGFDTIAVKTENAKQVVDGQFTVYSQNPHSDQKFNWEVKAVRADQPQLRVEKLLQDYAEH